MADGLVFSHFFFGRWKGQCAYTLIHVQLPYAIIYVQDSGGGGGILNFGKLGMLGKFKIFFKGGREH